MKRAIQTRASDQNQIETTILILSNSNSTFIQLVLQHHQLDLNLFKQIITNPAKFTSSGLLDLQRRIASDHPLPHTCQVGCSPNMCKGLLFSFHFFLFSFFSSLFFSFFLVLSTHLIILTSFKNQLTSDHDS